MEIKILKGCEILPYISILANLRITIFREYPYLYEGERTYEEKYLAMYRQTEHSIFCILEEGGKIIGAVTGLPLKEAPKEINHLFSAEFAKETFYLGEILLLKEFRKQGIGEKMYLSFENEVKKEYQKLLISEVSRSENDPKKPKDYTSLSQFWKKQGFIKVPNLITYFSWKEIGQDKESEHPMIFWKKVF